MIIDMINSGQKVSKVSDDYGLNDAMIRRWKKELKDFQMERYILKKAVGIFSRTNMSFTTI
tara:strand:- start:1035 stop:1217 length:183 start_codon:yes stop_codon:yes gene_type:complete